MAILAAIISAQLHADDWPQYAHNARRDATATSAPADLSAPLWTASENTAGQPLLFEGPSSPVVFNGRAYANARLYSGTSHESNKLVAFDLQTGEVLFETVITRATFNSWSSPGVDVAHATVLIGSGNTVYAIDATSGEITWATPLLRNIVNASICVADGLEPGRAFITDFDGTGSSGSLYCLNTSAFDAVFNPYDPGDIVWRETLGGTSGNTPAYLDGVVYVASITRAGSSPAMGHVFAFDVLAPEPTRQLWATPVNEGFFGGVTIAGGHVYAASYDLLGQQNNSTLVKLRSSDGAIQWTAACERTNSIPIVDGDMVYLAAGIPGFGSVPKVQAFLDTGTSAALAWDTYADTTGTLVVGGWTHQPALADGVLYCGKIPTGGSSFGAYTDLYLLDVTLTPDDPDFVIDQLTGIGSSPAIGDGRLYSIGPGGLTAVAALGDFCGTDGVVNGRDVQCFVDALRSENPTPAEIALGDFNSDSLLTVEDVPLFVETLVVTP